MEMVIGGAFQGKLEYAKKEYPQIQFEDGKSCTWEELKKAKGVYDFQEWIRRKMQKELDGGRSLEESKEAVQRRAQQLWEENPDLIIITNEIGYGVVPAERFEREYREAAGRACTFLAQKSGRVTRVMMGIGTVIKGD